MTKIEFTDEHLNVMITALEVYSRLRAGQIRIAIDTAFRDMEISYDESDSIEKFVKAIIYPGQPKLEYGAQIKDQYGRTYDMDGSRHDGQMTPEDKIRLMRYNSLVPGLFGRKQLSGSALAYEIYSTLRQYVSLKNNDGYEGDGVNYYNPLKTTKIPLPKIEGFSTEKMFLIKDRPVVEKLDKAQKIKDYDNVWNIIREYLKIKYPALGGYSQARLEKDDNHYVLIVDGARKK